MCLQKSEREACCNSPLPLPVHMQLPDTRKWQKHHPYVDKHVPYAGEDLNRHHVSTGSPQQAVPIVGNRTTQEAYCENAGYPVGENQCTGDPAKAIEGFRLDDLHVEK